MTGSTTTRWLAAGLWLLMIPACGTPPTPVPQRQIARHLIIVTIDTLRADRLGAYGSTTVPTPNFDRLAREGVRALDATAHVPVTRPAHTSLFTGRYPAEHGVRDNISLPLAKDVPTLAEVLSAQGFTTAAFVSSFVISKQSGLNRGFSHYDDTFAPAGGGGEPAPFLDAVQRRGDETVASVERWLDQRSPDARTTRMALWVHLYDPHDPYEPPEPFASRFADRPYDGEVAWTDTVLGRLRTALESRQLWNDAVVVVMADHGEAFGEHDETGHGFFAYETTLKIPFVILGPGLPTNSSIAGTVRTIDVMPTVLDLLGLASHVPALTGRSFAGNLAPGSAALANATYAESLTPLTHYQWSDLRVLREGNWKYILAPRPELYDLATDPGEATNLASAQPAKARALRASLETLLRQERERALRTDTQAPTLSAEVLQKLGALGYVSPGAAAGSLAQGADPKDKVGEFRRLSGLMREGLTLLRDGKFAASAAQLTELQKAGASSFQVHFYLGRALVGMGRMRDAERNFERAAEAMPNFAQAHLGVADARLSRQDYQGALAALRTGQAAAPNDPELIDREGQVWQSLGEATRALAAYQRVMDLAPKDALVRWRTGEVLLQQGQPERALELYKQAVALEPSIGDYWNSLGMVLGGAGQNAEAEKAFREAVTRGPANARYAYNLGLVLQRLRHPDARALFERTLALDPGFAPAKDRLAELAR